MTLIFTLHLKRSHKLPQTQKRVIISIRIRRKAIERKHLLLTKMLKVKSWTISMRKATSSTPPLWRKELKINSNLIIS